MHTLTLVKLSNVMLIGSLVAGEKSLKLLKPAQFGIATVNGIRQPYVSSLPCNPPFLVLSRYEFYYPVSDQGIYDAYVKTTSGLTIAQSLPEKSSLGALQS